MVNFKFLWQKITGNYSLGSMQKKLRWGSSRLHFPLLFCPLIDLYEKRASSDPSSGTKPGSQHGFFMYSEKTYKKRPFEGPKKDPGSQFSSLDQVLNIQKVRPPSLAVSRLIHGLITDSDLGNDNPPKMIYNEITSADRKSSVFRCYFQIKEVPMLQKLKTTDFDKLYNIMETSFPTDEYRPYEEQKALLENPLYHPYVLADEETGGLKAFIAVWNFTSFSFVEHFAVNPSYRNLGLGSQMLQELQSMLPHQICLEVELPETEMAARRIGFYQRNGFFYNDYPYMQPSISEGRNPIPLRIMTSGQAIALEDFLHIKEVLYTEVYKVKAGY